MSDLAASPLYQQLKQRTKPIHDALHGHPLLHRLLQPSCRMADYRQVLRIFAQFHQQAHAEFCNARLPRFDAEAPALQWLKEDFIAINDSKSLTVSAFAKSRTETVFADYLGYLYVKQGATLGGQVLCRTLSQSTGFSPQRGLRYFYGFGEQTKSNWLLFLGYLQRNEKHVESERVVASGVHYFQRLEALLTDAWSGDAAADRSSE